MSSIADLRKEYSRKGLDESDLPAAPLDLFRMWFNEACAAKLIEVRFIIITEISIQLGDDMYILKAKCDVPEYMQRQHSISEVCVIKSLRRQRICLVH